MEDTNTLKEVLGYEPGKAGMMHLIKIAKEQGVTLTEAATWAQIPKMIFDFERTGFADFDDEGRMKIEDYQKKHPFQKLIVIHGPDDNNQ